MQQEQIEKMILEYVTGLLPINSGESIKMNTRDAMRRLLANHKNAVMDEFCREHDLCTICKTYKPYPHCGSDHK